MSSLLEEFEVDDISIFEDVTKKMVQKASMENMCSKLPYEDISGKKPLFENTYMKIKGR